MTMSDYDDEFAELATIAHELTEFDPYMGGRHCVFCKQLFSKDHLPHCLFKLASSWRWRHASTPAGRP